MPSLSFKMNIAIMPATMGSMPRIMKKSTVLPTSYVNIAMTKTNTKATMENIDITPLTLPRLVLSVTSVTQVLKAASLAVEPKKVMTQSNMTSNAPMSPMVFVVGVTGIAAKSIIVTPHAI